MKIKIKKQISQRVINRFKKMCKYGLAVLAVQYLVNTAIV